MKFRFFSVVGLLGLASVNATQSRHLCSGFAPRNNLYIAAGSKDAGGLTHEEYDKALDRIAEKYTPIVAAHGGHLKIDHAWNDGEVNAYADQEGSTWIVHVFGGLARYQGLTVDGFTLVACHELGHHLGGAPEATNFAWASSVEGEADYFANLKCFRQVVDNDDNESVVKAMTIPNEVQARCTQQFFHYKDQLICERGAMAGLNGAKLLQYIRKEINAPSLTAPDQTVVASMCVTTDEDPCYPNTQCRLDTFLNAAQCAAPAAQELSSSDVTQGTCERPSFETGARPRCWFKFENY